MDAVAPIIKACLEQDPSLFVGVVGVVVALWLYWRALRSANPTSESWKRKLSGESIAAAYLALDEIENAQIG